jgi:hypothetical protein
MENAIPFNVRFRIAPMNGAIYFNNEIDSMTIEINDKSHDDLLPAEMTISKPISA